MLRPWYEQKHISLSNPLVASPLPLITLVQTCISLLQIRGTSSFFLVLVHIYSRNYMAPWHDHFKIIWTHGSTLRTSKMQNKTMFYMKMETNYLFHGGDVWKQYCIIGLSCFLCPWLILNNIFFPIFYYLKVSPQGYTFILLKKKVALKWVKIKACNF